MENIIYWLYYILLVASFISGILYYKNLAILLSYLRAKHADKIDGLGLSMKADSNGLTLSEIRYGFRFIRSSEYFSDSILNSQKKKASLYYNICLLSLISAFLLSISSYLISK